MRRFLVLVVAVTFALACDIQPQTAGQDSDLLIHVRTIPLDGIEGRIDHIGADAKAKRLFVAALGNDTVEVVDLATGKVTQQIKNLRAPQGVGFAPESNRLAVANDEDGSLRLYDGTLLRQTAAVNLKNDADNIRYDVGSRRFWVGYGEGGLAEIDPVSGRQLANVKLRGHPESFQLETKSNRIFVNVPSAGQVAVVDRKTATVVENFSLKEAAANFPMALDETNQRLFVGCRHPAKLLVLDMGPGKTVAALDIVGDTDDVFYDAIDRRIYISGGAGAITMINQTNANKYNVVERLTTAPGARTSFFVPETKTLYVAVPHRGHQRAELRAYTVPGPK
jgi:YVTN family beta-propeller protein